MEYKKEDHYLFLRLKCVLLLINMQTQKKKKKNIFQRQRTPAGQRELYPYLIDRISWKKISAIVLDIYRFAKEPIEGEAFSWITVRRCSFAPSLLDFWRGYLYSLSILAEPLQTVCDPKPVCAYCKTRSIEINRDQPVRSLYEILSEKVASSLSTEGRVA